MGIIAKYGIIWRKRDQNYCFKVHKIFLYRERFQLPNAKLLKKVVGFDHSFLGKTISITILFVEQSRSRFSQYDSPNRLSLGRTVSITCLMHAVVFCHCTHSSSFKVILFFFIALSFGTIDQGNVILPALHPLLLGRSNALVQV